MNNPHNLAADLVSLREELGIQVSLGSCGDCVVKRALSTRDSNYRCSYRCHETIGDSIFKGDDNAEIKVGNYIDTITAIKEIHE